jgi:hypothetical protein
VQKLAWRALEVLGGDAKTGQVVERTCCRKHAQRRRIERHYRALAVRSIGLRIASAVLVAALARLSGA